MQAQLDGYLVAVCAGVDAMDDKVSRDTEITRQWNRLLGHSEEEVRLVATAAFKHPALRSLFPFTSHWEVRFSTTFPYPYDWDLPYTLGYNGVYQVMLEQRALFEGSLEECIARTASMIDGIVKARSVGGRER